MPASSLQHVVWLPASEGAVPRLARLPGERRASGTRSGAWDAGDGGPRRTSPTLGVILLRSRLRQRDEDEQAAAHRRVSGATPGEL